MNYQKLTKSYMTLILALGLVCFLWAIATLPTDRADLNLLLLSLLTIGIGSRMSIQIPQVLFPILLSSSLFLRMAASMPFCLPRLKHFSPHGDSVIKR